MDYYYAEDIIKKLKKAQQLIVFGAGNVASLIVECLQGEFYNLSIEYCMVSSKRGNPDCVKNIPVIDYASAGQLVRKDALILITVVEKFLDSIVESLCSRGYKNFIPLTYESDLWSMLRGNIFRNEMISQRRAYLTIEDELLQPGDVVEKREYEYEKSISVYSARSHVDKELRENISRFSWEIPIQVGADLTDQRICDVADNIGDHISEKNRQYCELTALYWIWKNDKSDYVGLGHYRRHFELNKLLLSQLTYTDIDVVLTIPIMDIPSVEAVYRRDHISADWDILLEAVETLAPDYMEAVRWMQNGRFYYAYNMFIMRREILEKYCSWLFPIFFYCEAHSEKKEDDYQDRYLGFLADHKMSD